MTLPTTLIQVLLNLNHGCWTLYGCISRLNQFGSEFGTSLAHKSIKVLQNRTKVFRIWLNLVQNESLWPTVESIWPNVESICIGFDSCWSKAGPIWFKIVEPGNRGPRIFGEKMKSLKGDCFQHWCTFLRNWINFGVTVISWISLKVPQFDDHRVSGSTESNRLVFTTAPICINWVLTRRQSSSALYHVALLSSTTSGKKWTKLAQTWINMLRNWIYSLRTCIILLRNWFNLVQKLTNLVHHSINLAQRWVNFLRDWFNFVQTWSNLVQIYSTGKPVTNCFLKLFDSLFLNYCAGSASNVEVILFEIESISKSNSFQWPQKLETCSKVRGRPVSGSTEFTPHGVRHCTFLNQWGFQTEAICFGIVPQCFRIEPLLPKIDPSWLPAQTICMTSNQISSQLKQRAAKLNQFASICFQIEFIWHGRHKRFNVV